MSSNQPTVTAPPARFRLRVRYAKRGRLRYLGHLELIHTIERCIRRAALPYAVSQGFSPHMRVGYTSALPVGTGSACEYYDVFLTELVPAPEALERLRAATPFDLAPDTAAYVDLRTPALTADITRVDYLIELAPQPGCEVSPERIDAALQTVKGVGELPYLRGKKRKTLDLSTLLSWRLSASDDGCMLLGIATRCDNEGSLRPELLLAAVDQVLCGIEPGSEEINSTGIQDLSCIGRYRVERTSQLVADEDGTVRTPLAEEPEPPSGTLSAAALAKL